MKNIEAEKKQIENECRDRFYLQMYADYLDGGMEDKAKEVLKIWRGEKCC